MNKSVNIEWHMTQDQNKVIEEAVHHERGKLLSFIRKSIPDETEAEDILQDVLYLFVENYRAVKPIEQVSAWLFRVVRNKIIDRFRKKKAIPMSKMAATTGNDPESEESWNWADFLPDTIDDPETVFVKKMLMQEILDAIEELPDEQKTVFVAHEIEGRSFKEIAGKTGVSVNTLLSRKRYAILFLRTRLKEMYDEFNNN